jgi:hypothetical protein
MPEIRCITCSHPVHKDDPDVAFIKMSNQARYFHKNSRGCQDAEAGNKYDDNSRYGEHIIDEETYLRLGLEKKEMMQSE